MSRKPNLIDQLSKAGKSKSIPGVKKTVVALVERQCLVACKML